MAKLTVSRGLLYLGGQLCREVGWNCSALLARRWYNSSDTEHVRIIDALAANGVRVIRVVGMPSAPGTAPRTSGNWDTWGIPAGVPAGNAYTDLSSTFYTKHREVLDYCETKGISVIITMMGRMATLADLKGETQSVGFGSAGSATRTFARTIFANYVNALKDHPAIAAWEINNEWNNYAELQALPGSATGSPVYSSPGDLVSVAKFAETMVELAGVVKANDSTRAVLSGNAGGWNTNAFGLDGYARLLPTLNPDPIDTISFHQYSDPNNNGYLESGFGPLVDLIQQAKAVGAKVGKPLIVGEIGVRETLSTKAKDWRALQEFLRDPSGPQITLLWDFYPQGLTLPDSSAVFSCFPGDPRAYQVDAVRETQARSIPYLRTPLRSKVRPPTAWLDFQGTGQRLTRSLPIAFSGPFVVAFWARFMNARDGANFSRMFSTTSNESSNGFAIQQNPAAAFDEPYFRLFNGSGGQSATLRQGRLRFNRWNHFAYRFNTTTMTLEPFFNGFQATSAYASYTGSWVAPAGSMVIGADYSGASTSFKGQMAQVTVADRALDDEEMFGLACGVAPSDALRWLVNGIDSDLTVVGSPTWKTAPARQMRAA